MVLDVPAPVGGLNYISSDDVMPQEDAKVLDNWIPDAGFCKCRESATVYADVTVE